MPVYAIEFVIKLTVICFSNNIKILLNMAKLIPVNGVGRVVSKHIISIGNSNPHFTAWCQGLGM